MKNIDINNNIKENKDKYDDRIIENNLEKIKVNKIFNRNKFQKNKQNLKKILETNKKESEEISFEPNEIDKNKEKKKK